MNGTFELSYACVAPFGSSLCSRFRTICCAGAAQLPPSIKKKKYMYWELLFRSEVQHANHYTTAPPPCGTEALNYMACPLLSFFLRGAGGLTYVKRGLNRSTTVSSRHGLLSLPTHPSPPPPPPPPPSSSSSGYIDFWNILNVFCFCFSV